MKKILTALGAAALTSALALSGGAALAAGGATGHGAASSAPAVLPYHGHYSGSDQHHRLVRFSFDGHTIRGFAVNGTHFGNAHVGIAHQWHKTCHNGRCFEGRWIDDTTVEGRWFTDQGHGVHYVAHLFSH